MKISPKPVIAYQQGKKSGQVEGVKAFSSLALLAGENVCEDSMTEETFRKFFPAWESECYRLLVEEFHEDVSDMVERVNYYTNKIRKEMGLEEL